MLLPIAELEEKMLEDVRRELGDEEMLSQCSEECAELIQAAQKMRRVLHGTTPVGRAQAQSSLCEEAADVLVCLDALMRDGVLPFWDVVKIARHKINRWHGRTCGKEMAP